MFSVNPRQDSLESLELRDSDAKSMCVLAPSRGGMATRLALGGRHVFFLDESTLRDTTKNVRGGNPVLFPTPGKLVSDAWARDGKKGSQKQHGFARNAAWEIGKNATDGAASATLSLASSDATRADYPWDFRADYTYSLSGKKLRIEQRFENIGKEPMPFGAGFHPYFHVKQSDKARTKIGTPARRAFDNVTKKEVAVPETGIDLSVDEVDLHLLDHGANACTLQTPERTITVRGSEEFTHYVVWTLAGKDFVCVEPWTAPGNAMNTGDRVLVLAPGASKTLWVEYEAS